MKKKNEKEKEEIIKKFVFKNAKQVNKHQKIIKFEKKRKNGKKKKKAKRNKEKNKEKKTRKKK